MKKVITRRDFMRGGTYAVLGMALGLPQRQIKKTKVILVRHPDAVDENARFNEKIIQQMLDEAIMALFDYDDPVKSFKKLVKPDDIVGIKSNVWAYIPTPKELENAIQNRLIDAGIKKENISVDDRGVLRNPVFQKSTALINVRPMRMHYLAGFSGCLKNYITFAKRYSDYHPNNCADLALLYRLPHVEGKTRLNILAVLTPQFHARGPHNFNRRYVWNYKGLLVGMDPVAIDAVGLEIMKAKRREQFGKSREMPGVPRHVEIADVKHGLGTSNLNNIDLVKLGWKEDILI